MSGVQRKAMKNATFLVPHATWRRAKKRALDEERSLNDIVVKALDAFAGAETTGEAPLAEFLEFARAAAARQPKIGRPVRSFTKDELHGRGE